MIPESDPSSDAPAPANDELPAVAPDAGNEDRTDEIDHAVPTRGYGMLPVVGLGGSAGSIGAMQQFLKAMPADSGMAFVIILHLSPDHISTLPEIFQRSTPMRVITATDGVALEANCVFIIPAGKHLSSTDGHLRLTEAANPNGKRVAVDVFFRTLADTHGPRSVAIVLSGGNGGGAIGIKRIKERGGLTIAQDPGEAEHSDMPRSAIATGMVDWVLKVDEMPARLLEYRQRGEGLKLPTENGPLPTEVTVPSSSEEESTLREIMLTSGLSAGELHRRFIERFSPPSILVNADHEIVHVSETAGRFLQFPTGDPTRNLLQTVHPALRIELQAALYTAVQSREPATAHGVSFDAGEGQNIVDIRVSLADDLASEFLLVVFIAHASVGKVDQLAESNSDLTNLMSATDIAIVFLDRELRIVRFTPSANSLFNFISTDLGRPLSDLSRKLDYPEIVADAEQAIAHLRPVEREVHAGERSFLARILPYHTADNHIAGVVITFTDITTMKEVEAATARLAAIVESSTDAIVGKDLRGIVTSWNAGAEKIFGYTAAEMIGQPVARLIPAERQTEETEILRKISVGETIRSFETIRVRKDRTTIPISATISPIKNAAGKIIGGSKIARDISAAKKIEAALVESEEEFRSLADSVPQIVWATRPDGRTTYCNQKWVEYTGLSLEESYGCDWTAPFHPDDKSPATAAWKHAIATETIFAIECRLRRADGVYRWWLIRSEPRRDAQGKLQKWFGTCTDIEELKKAEESMRLAHQRLQAVMNSITDGLAVLDKEWRYTYMNEQGARLIGKPREELLGNCVWELFPQAKETKFEEGYHRAMATGQRVEFQEYYPEPINKWLECYCYPSKDGLSVYFHDVTARHQAEAMLRQNAELFTTLIEQAPLGVYVVDEQLRLQQINSLAMPSFGAVHPLIGRDFSEVTEILWGPEVGGENARIFRHTLATGERYMSPPFVHTRQDVGVEQAFEWETQRIILPDGHYGVVCYFTDITERRRTQAALREAKEAAESANQDKDRFLAVLSHELRTPLTPVLMAVSALERDPDLRPAVRDDLMMIKRNVQLETKLIDDLLDLSRITSGKVELTSEAVDLNEAVRQVSRICEPQLVEQNVRLETNLDDGVSSIAADPARLQQILWNILKNAVKFTPAEGIVHIHTERLGNDRVVVRVRDSGIGIPSEVLPRIFNAFEQGDPKITRQFGGLGLGLAITRTLVELHGGTIRAESEGPGKGATFTVELPGQTALPLNTPSAAASEDSRRQEQIRLLLVEDHADTARMLELQLRAAGFTVTSAANVADATAAAERETFDLLVSDLGLPDGDGYEVLRAVHARQFVPGIAMSGYGMDNDLRRSNDAGFAEHLVKPIAMDQLIAAIRRATEPRGFVCGP